jgi:hypothetical protein
MSVSKPRVVSLIARHLKRVPCAYYFAAQVRVPDDHFVYPLWLARADAGGRPL